MKLFFCFSALLWAAATTPFASAGSATWSPSPLTGDWNTATNWMPSVVPNGPADTATFDASSTRDISISRKTAVGGILFDPAASSFMITTNPGVTLTISGTGIVNNSGVTQSFINPANNTSMVEDIVFTNNATAGSMTLFTNNGAAGEGRGRVRFFDSSTAGGAELINNGFSPGGVGGRAEFHDSSTAGNGSFTNNGGGFLGGTTEFYDSSNAGTATFTTYAGDGSSGLVKFNETSSGAYGTFIINTGLLYFYDSTTADHAMVTANYGTVGFFDFATAGDATLIANAGGKITFFGSADHGGSAGHATIIVNGGEGVGGQCGFGNGADGGTSRIEVFGNGILSVTATRLTVGSIEGDGTISILSSETLSVGSNNLNTLFSGVIGNLGSLTKVGNGLLTLTGANTYNLRTTVETGGLVINNATGSGTGASTVLVNGGTLGGGGTIARTVTIGTGSGAGAFLAPSLGASQATTLTIQSLLTCKADATYTCKLNSKKNRADQVAANGVTIESGAQFNFQVSGNKKLRTGKTVTAISNTSANPISGTFANLPDNSSLTIGSNTFQVSYSGGDGNDLTLTVTP